MNANFNRIHEDRTMDEVILDHLKKVGNVTALEAQGMYKCRSLSRRITTLKRQGHLIRSVAKIDATGQRYVRYHYVGPTDGARALEAFR